MHKPFARKLRQLSSLRKRIIEAARESARCKLIRRYQRLLNYLLTHLPHRKLAKFLFIPGIFAFHGSSSIQAQNFLAADTSLVTAPILDLARPVTADLDGDGDLDIFYHDYETEGMRYVENISQGGELQFAEPVLSPLFPEDSFSYGFFAIGDIDDDGDLDVVLFLGYYDDGTQMVFSTFENTGSPTEPQFVPGDQPIVVEGAGIMLPSLADLDGDGDLDLMGTLITETYDGPQILSAVYFENNEGVFGPQQTQESINLTLSQNTMMAVTAVGDLTIGDLDADGDLDILTYEAGVDQAGQYSFDYLYYENTGSAEAPDFADPIFNPFGLPAEQVEQPFNFPHFADLDGDGDLDILASIYYTETEASKLLFYENSGSVMTAITDHDIVELTISPNPVADVLQIEADFFIKHIDIYDSSGKVVKEVIESSGGISSVVVSDLPRGSYSGLVSGPQQLARIRFIKL